LLSLRNAFHFARYLCKSNIFYLEYDCTVNFDDFEKEFVAPLKDQNYEACVDVVDNDHCQTGYYSIKTDLAIKIVDAPKNQDDFFRKLGFGFEKWFFNALLDNVNDQFYSVDYKDENHQVNRFAVCDRFSDDGIYFLATPVLDAEDYFYIFFDNLFEDDVTLALDLDGTKEEICLRHGHWLVKKICHISHDKVVRITHNNKLMVEYRASDYKDTYHLNNIVFK